MHLLTGPDNPILRTRAQAVTSFDENLQKTVDQMIDTMLSPGQDDVQGIGLAANQVGLLERIMIITLNVETKKEREILVMINPEILETSKETISMEEGCLSLPGVFGKVTRPKKVRIKWQNLKGHWCEKKLSGWDARIFQHEQDHLEGILFIDRIKKS